MILMSYSPGKIPVAKALLWAGGILVLALMFPTVFKVIFAARDELSYSAGVDSTTCAGIPGNASTPSENCLTIYTISLGNTGVNPQASIDVSLRNGPEPWRFGNSVVDIVASARRREVPTVDYRSESGLTYFHVENLQPNRLLELHMSYLGFAAYEQLQDVSVEVSALGSVIESNLHLTVLSRFFRNLTLLF